MARNQIPNSPIGKCLCPFRGCPLIGDVFRYRAHPGATRTVRAGKLYMRCANHGMTQDQDYIKQYATIDQAAPDTTLKIGTDATDPKPGGAVESQESEPQPPAAKNEAIDSPVTDDHASADTRTPPETPEKAVPWGFFS